MWDAQDQIELRGVDVKDVIPERVYKRSLEIVNRIIDIENTHFLAEMFAPVVHRLYTRRVIRNN